MTRAVDSALTAMAARQVTHPQRRSVLVLATDGQPSGCGENQNVASVVARLEQGTRLPTPILTYVVGVFSPAEIAMAQPALQRIAAAGGTMSPPFILATGDDLTQKLLDALKAIRGLSVACEYSIPQPATGSIDFGKVNVRTTSQSGSDEPGNVASVDRCSPDQGGWYYDPPPSAGDPKRLILCPATCERLRADPTAKVDLVFGCATVVIK
jgi:hypothetical protein